MDASFGGAAVAAVLLLICSSGCSSTPPVEGLLTLTPRKGWMVGWLLRKCPRARHIHNCLCPVFCLLILHASVYGYRCAPFIGVNVVCPITHTR